MPTKPPKPEMDKHERFEEDQIVLEAAGLRLTVFMQEYPDRVQHAATSEQFRAGEILKVWWSAQGVKQYGKFIL